MLGPHCPCILPVSVVFPKASSWCCLRYQLWSKGIRKRLIEYLCTLVYTLFMSPCRESSPTTAAATGSSPIGMSLYQNRVPRPAFALKSQTSKTSRPSRTSESGGGSALGRPLDGETSPSAAISKSDRRMQMESLSRQGFTFQYQSSPVGIVGKKPHQRSATLRSFASHDSKPAISAALQDDSLPVDHDPLLDLASDHLPENEAETSSEDASGRRISMSRLEQHNRMVRQQSGKSRAKQWTEDIQTAPMAGTTSLDKPPLNSDVVYDTPVTSNNTLIGKDGNYLLPDFPSRNAISAASSGVSKTVTFIYPMLHNTILVVIMIAWYCPMYPRGCFCMNWFMIW